jgi:hypothetical protein
VKTTFAQGFTFVFFKIAGALKGEYVAHCGLPICNFVFSVFVAYCLLLIAY